MAILSIARDWGPNVSIVRIETDDPIETIVLGGWLITAANAADIEELNNGPFEWKSNDFVVVAYPSGVPTVLAHGLFSIFPAFDSLNPIAPLYSNLQNITAHAGGGQPNATGLNLGINVVTTVATTADSVVLPDDVLGNTVIVHNVGANSCNVFPFLGDAINALAVNTAIALAANSRAIFIGTQITKWASFINP